LDPASRAQQIHSGKFTAQQGVPFDRKEKMSFKNQGLTKLELAQLYLILLLRPIPFFVSSILQKSVEEKEKSFKLFLGNSLVAHVQTNSRQKWMLEMGKRHLRKMLS
jgi:hypothetical protein